MIIETLTQVIRGEGGSLAVKAAASKSEVDGAFDFLKRSLPGLDRNKLLEIYRLMLIARLMDEYELTLLKKGKAWFTIAGAGIEAAGVSAGLALRKTDPIFPHYRDRSTCIARGLTPFEMFQEAVASRNDPNSAGVQMSGHYSKRALAIYSVTSPTGSQALPGEGCAEAIRKTKSVLGTGNFPADSVVYVGVGDAMMSQGEIYEAVKDAALTRAPFILHIMDNAFGISVPSYEQHPGGNPAAIFAAVPNLTILEVDGTDVGECLNAFTYAVSECRKGLGPFIVHTKCVRLMSHSSADDQRKYRPIYELEWEKERDPLPKFARQLIAGGIATPSELEQVTHDAEASVKEALDRALNEPKTDTTTLLERIYSGKDARAEFKKVVDGKKSEIAGQNVVMAEAINKCLDELMSADKRIVMWGEDVADFGKKIYQNPIWLKTLEGKGGVFVVTKGLQRKHGFDRVFNSPLAEATIIGWAIGYSMQGFIPVPEIQFRDFLNPAWQQLIDEVATLSFRTNRDWTCPMVIRMAYGGYLHGGGAIWHSESALGPLMYHPGIRIAVPSNPRNAVGLLRGAIYSGDPVIFVEPKALYRMKGEFYNPNYPDFDFVIPPGDGSSEVYGDGKDLTLIGFGNTAPMCFQAAKLLKEHKINARFVNLLWLNPLDVKTIREHAAVTKRVLIVEEDRRTCGAGSHIADAIYSDRKLRKDVEVERLSAENCRVPYGDVGEKEILPQMEDILNAAVEITRG